MTTRNGPAQRAALSDEVSLADELLERSRAHPGGQRLALRRRSEEGFWTGSSEARTGPTGGHDRQSTRRRVGSGQAAAPMVVITQISARIPKTSPAVRPIRRTSRAT